MNKKDSIRDAHIYFSADCFNNTWNFLEKENRTAEDDKQMLLLAMASAWHWTQREDVTDQNMSVGYWLLSRVYAVLGEAENSLKYAKSCLDKCQGKGIPPFYLGYAYEALARAEWVAGHSDKVKEYLEQANLAAEKIKDKDNQQMLLDDLDGIN